MLGPPPCPGAPGTGPLARWTIAYWKVEQPNSQKTNTVPVFSNPQSAAVKCHRLDELLRIKEQRVARLSTQRSREETTEKDGNDAENERGPDGHIRQRPNKVACAGRQTRAQKNRKVDIVTQKLGAEPENYEQSEKCWQGDNAPNKPV